MIESIKFGDVFFHREKEYIFLAKTEEIIYAAEILDEARTYELNQAYGRYCRGPKEKLCLANPYYCFVELKTEDFRGRAAHFLRPDKDGSIKIQKAGKSLIEEDQAEIKKEILGGPLPNGLKKIIEDLDI